MKNQSVLTLVLMVVGAVAILYLASTELSSVVEIEPPYILLSLLGMTTVVMVALDTWKAKGRDLKTAEPAAVTAVSVTKAPEAPKRRRPKNWDEALFVCDWYQFEKVLELAFNRVGYRVTRSGGAHADGGIDLVLENGERRVAVQCKHWTGEYVTVSEVRELVGSMVDFQISEGMLVTVLGFSEDARSYAKRQNISLMEKWQIIQLLDEANLWNDPEAERILSDDEKRCPKCEKIMVLKTATRGRRQGEKFWGCSGFPKCRQRLAFREG
jgi:hypothetical protein